MRRLALPLAFFAITVPASAQQQPIPPTRGPNGAVLGSALEGRTAGPGWVCFIDNGVALAAGEAAYIDYMGFHAAAWRLVGPRGQILVREGDSWAEPAEPGRVVPDARGRKIVRYGTSGEFRYLIYGVVEAAGPGQRPSVWVEGPALAGDGADRTILDRIEPRRRPAPCRRRILYGFFYD